MSKPRHIAKQIKPNAEKAKVFIYERTQSQAEIEAQVKAWLSTAPKVRAVFVVQPDDE